MHLSETSVEKNGVAHPRQARTYWNISVLRVKGYLDVTTAGELERAIKALFEAQRYHLIIDLKEVEYISSLGWGVFLGNLREARIGGGELVLTGMQTHVYEVYRLLEFEWFLKSFDSLDEAVAAFSPPPNGASTNGSATGQPSLITKITK